MRTRSAAAAVSFGALALAGPAVPAAQATEITPASADGCFRHTFPAPRRRPWSRR
ncbi:hypothetical protein [Streptomyces aurantiogriseus]|uniref:hypothetical protein n=1 Tax=Streptomyces aurantiogriseus TaxID=66870 RepID=UPI001677F05A|nr:hypothetical protein [Streptomyces aurantiogriseus]